MARIVPMNDLKRQYESLAVGLSEAAARVVASGYYLLGPELAAFEHDFAAACGSAHCVGLGNGTDALLLALLALDCGQGDEVATVANAGMYATVAILATGARPLYVDIDPDTLTMSPASLAARLTPSTKAVIVTHLYGQMAAMPELMRVAALAGLPIVEDCAQAAGARLDDQAAGAWGIVGCYSFYPTKNLGALGDAGAVITSDKGLAERVRQLRQYGWREKYHSVLPRGRNSRMDELQAAMLRVKLPHLERWNERRRQIVRSYRAATEPLSPRWPSGDVPSFVAHLAVTRCHRRDELRRWLKADGVMTDIHYPVPDYRQPAIIAQIGPGDPLAETERAVGEVLSLPCFPELTDDEVEQVSRSLVHFHERQG